MRFVLAFAFALSMSVPMTAAATCEAPEQKHFDFWIGDWTVTAPEGGPNPGKALGTNRIERVSAGCGLLETWTGAGGLQGKAMVMHGELPAAKGGVQQQKVTWTPNDDGSVTQHWQVSDDAGATWSTSFLGVYRRTATP